MSDRRYRCKVCSFENVGPVEPTLSASVVLGYCVSCKRRTPAADLGEVAPTPPPAPEAVDVAAIARTVFADDLAPAEAGGDDHVQAAYLEWRRTSDGMAVVEAIRRRAVELRRRGWRRYGIQALAEVARFDRSLSVGPDAAGFKVNNSHLSRLARDLMDDDPSLGGFFETRSLRSDGAEEVHDDG